MIKRLGLSVASLLLFAGCANTTTQTRSASRQYPALVMPTPTAQTYRTPDGRTWTQRTDGGAQRLVFADAAAPAPWTESIGFGKMSGKSFSDFKKAVPSLLDLRGVQSSVTEIDDQNIVITTANPKLKTSVARIIGQPNGFLMIEYVNRLPNREEAVRRWVTILSRPELSNAHW